MSYDLVFWSDPREQRPEPALVHEELLGGGTVEGLGAFDARAVLASLGDHFPGLEPPEATAGSTAWEGPDNQAVFEFSWSPQHLVVTARGRYTNDQLNAVVDAGTGVDDGCLYDPQTDERFDGS